MGDSTTRIRGIVKEDKVGHVRGSANEVTTVGTGGPVVQILDRGEPFDNEDVVASLGFEHLSPEAWARARERDDQSEPASFQEWVLDRFGEGLARHFFYPYNRKLYRIEPDQMNLDWVGRYVPRPRLEEVVDGAFGLYQAPGGYNTTFRYPRTGGIRLLPDQVASRPEQLRLGTEVQSVHLQEHWLELTDGERLSWPQLISTISLPSPLDCLAGELPPELVAARQCLRWFRVLNLALDVAGDAPRPEH